MYLILEEEILSTWGEWLDTRYHLIPVGDLGDPEAVEQMEEFDGFMIRGVREPIESDIMWRWNRITKEWKVVGE